MKFKLLLAASLLALLSAAAFAQGGVEHLFEKGDRLSYNGYTITRTYKGGDETPLGTSRTFVRRGARVLASVEGSPHKEATRFFLFPLLGGRRKQLVVESYSGGGHCCTSYRIYDLSARFRTLFDGERYERPDDLGVGNEMRLLDIDRDGTFEFVQSVMTFDYFYASHAMSVFPEAVFAYDWRAGQYRPAGRAFAVYLLRDIGKKKQAVEKLNAQLHAGDGLQFRGMQGLKEIWFREEYFNAVANVLLTYIYAGHEAEGWAYFDENYRLTDKARLRADLLKKLSQSSIYRAIYSRRG
jgi:hypothetical protein